MVREFFGLWLVKKNFPIHYFGKFLYRKDYKNPYDYMDMKQFRSIIYSKRNNQEEYVHLLSNKFHFSLLCEKYRLPTPRMVSYNMGNTFFYGDSVYTVEDQEGLFGCFDKVFKATGLEKLFIKSFCGYGGTEVLLLTHPRLKEQLNEFGHRLLKKAFVHQECIVQHAEINEIYSHCVNTLRVETFIDDSSKVNILGMFMRFGSGGKFVDNLTSGGFYVPVEPSTGKLKAQGLQKMISGGKVFSRHPDTDYEFKDYKLPDFEDARELCLKLAKYIPNRLAGWDIAFTPSGPIVVEGNHTPGMAGEMGYGGYVKHPAFKEMMMKS